MSKGKRSGDRTKTGPTPKRRDRQPRWEPPDTAVAAAALMNSMLAVSNRRARPAFEISSGELHMTVASGIATGTDLAHEEDLVSAALLYADRVTLLSPAAHLIDALDILSEGNFADLAVIFKAIQSYVQRPSAALAAATPAQIAVALNDRPDMLQGLRDAVAALTSSGSNQRLRNLRERGLLHVDPLAPRTEDTANLARLRQRISTTDRDGEMNEAIDVMFARLMTVLTSGNSLPLFDDNIGSMAQNGISEGLFVPARTAGARAAEAGLAAGFIERLPAFPRADINDILDVRSTLQGPLVAFRAEVTRMSTDMADHALEPDFASEVDLQWRRTVAPALQEIKDSIESDTYLKALTEQVLDPGIVEGGLSTVGGGLGVIIGQTGASAAIGAAAAYGAKIFTAARQARRVARDERSGSGFWFLHEANRRLGR